MTLRGFTWAGAGFIAAIAAGWLAYPALFYRTEAQPMAFSHSVHTGEAAGIECNACHTIADDGSFGGIPRTEGCAGCHGSPIGESEAERLLVERYVTPGEEIPWKSYWRQPDNAWFSHAIHVRKGGIECAECHGGRGTSTDAGERMVNRLTGYPADVERITLAGLAGREAVGMKMDRCTGCHASRGFRSGCIACHQ